MRASLGVALELMALVIVLYVASLLANWFPLSILALLFAQVLTSVLVHCPAHYLVGRALGIRFSGIGVGRSTMANALPGSLKRIGSLLIVFTLRVDPGSRKTVSRVRLRAMFLAGVSASLADAVVLALVVTLAGYYAAALVMWIFALAYLVSDVAFSPRAGDLMRARAVTAES